MTRSALVDRVLDGHPASIARAISRIERRSDGVAADRAELHAHTGRAHIVGITGPPGSGKSTLVSRVAHVLRRRGRTVGIVAVDPSSPFTGGSILGDRVRMGGLSGDPGVFIRSMATRGWHGGLARSTSDVVNVLDAAGKDVVIIESVGVGQDEIEVVRASHTTVVVSVPGLGDDIQAIKAGVLEIADIHVVNKADRDGAQRLRAQLRDMLRLAGGVAPGSWRVPVHLTVAETGDGVEELCDLVDQHRQWLSASPAWDARERRMAAARVRAMVHELVNERLVDPAVGAEFDMVVGDVVARKLDPLSAAQALLDKQPGKG